MALAVEAVKSGKRSPEYWEVERRWIAGETAQIIRESQARVKLDAPIGGSAAGPPPAGTSSLPRPN